MIHRLRINNLLANTRYNKAMVIFCFGFILLMMPKIIFQIYGYDFLFKFYNYKSSGLVESFQQIEKSFYLGYYLLIITIMVVITIIFYPDKIKHWELRNYFYYSAIISSLFLIVLLINGPWNTELYTHEVTSAIVRIKHFFKGEIIYWYDGRGFGTPFPTVQAPDTHPIFLLSPLNFIVELIEE